MSRILSDEERAALLRSADNVRRAAEAQLRSKDRQAVIGFVASLQTGIDRVTAAAAGRGVALACQAGCSHCCHARVEALGPEIFRIARHLRSLPDAELAALGERLRRHAALPAEAATWRQRPACPFLADGLCSIYALRPAACRKAHSLDASACAAGAARIPQDLGLVVAVEALASGTAHAYMALGYQAAGHELAAGVLLALGDPSAESRWLDGEAVFAGNGAGRATSR